MTDGNAGKKHLTSWERACDAGRSTDSCRNERRAFLGLSSQVGNGLNLITSHYTLMLPSGTSGWMKALEPNWKRISFRILLLVLARNGLKLLFRQKKQTTFFYTCQGEARPGQNGRLSFELPPRHRKTRVVF